MYESPIKIIESAMDSCYKSLVKEKEDAIIFEVKRSLGVDIDKSELLQALQYDRNQYDKGYDDGKRDAMDELVRCKDCTEWDETEQECKHWYGFRADDFCSNGERRPE